MLYFSGGRRAELELDDFKDGWYRIIELLPFPVTVNDNNYNIVKANAAAHKLFDLDNKTHLKCYQIFDGQDYPPENCVCGWGSKKPLVLRENSKFFKLPCQKIYIPLMNNDVLDGFVNLLIPDLFEYSDGIVHAGQLNPENGDSKRGLSPRELQVVNWLKEGKSNWEIARLMEISEDTVKYHLKSIMRKLNVVNRAHAVAKVMEYEMQMAEKYHEARMREISHRVKNSLSSLKGLLYMWRCRSDGKSVEQSLLDIESRLSTVAELFDELSKDGKIESVHAPIYIGKIVALIKDGHLDIESSLEIELDVDSIKLNPEAASECGFIIHELLTNCILHAFPGGDGSTKGNRISLKLKKLEGKGYLSLMVSDNGVGFKVDPEREKSLGLELVELLAANAEGTVKYSAAGVSGAQVTVNLNIE